MVAVSHCNKSSKERGMKKTALYDWHQRHGARIIDFGGYLMPVQYSGIIAEHRAVRSGAGLFDVSHMGNFVVRGGGATRFLQHMTSNDVSRLSDGEAQYTLMLYPDGGIVDDLIIYRMARDTWFMVVNASNMEKDFEWLMQHVGEFDDVLLENRTDDLSLIALQGPESMSVLEKVFPGVSPLLSKPFTFSTQRFHEYEAVIAATGYTGEKGVEISLPNEGAEALWQALMDAGQDIGIAPIGLGARDTLRLEMGYPLYGHEIDRTTNPLEARLKWVTRLEKEEFIGKDACLEVSRNPQRTVTGFIMQERAIPRQGFTLYNLKKEPVGEVCSGTMSPTLQKPLGTASILREYMAPGTPVLLEVRGRYFRGQVEQLPFVNNS